MRPSNLIPIFALVAALLPAAGFTQSLTLEDAVLRALASHPALQAEEFSLRAAERRADLAALSPALTIGGEVENVAGTGELRGLDAAETTLRVARVFELGRKRQLRRQAGTASVDLHRNTQDQRRVAVIADTTRRYVQLVSTQEVLGLRSSSLQLARENAEAVAHRVERGRASESDRVLADLEVVRAELSLEDATHEMDAARVSLSVLWGDTAATFDRVSGHLEPLPPIPLWTAVTASLDASPGLLVYTLEDRSLAALGSLARAEGIPDLTASLGVRRLEAIDDQALVLSLSVPVGLRSRSALALEENRLQRKALDARREAARLEFHQLLYARYRELEHAAHEVASTRDEMIPRAEQALKLVQRGYEDARYSFLEVVQARALLLDLKDQHIDAAARFHQVLADIQQLTALSGELQP
ncbi:MAG: TolC family protein [Gammaproteobacteria bacterium]|nr:TolC family protein [Gammaproteobacteria bacterium]